MFVFLDLCPVYPMLPVSQVIKFDFLNWDRHLLLDWPILETPQCMSECSFVLFRFVSINFVSFYFVPFTFCFVPFRFVLVNFVSFHFVSFHFACFVSRFISHFTGTLQTNTCYLYLGEIFFKFYNAMTKMIRRDTFILQE